MHATSQTPSSAEVATEVSGLLAGLGILTMALFPVALPGLLLFVVAPLGLVAIAGVLVAIPLILPLWLARLVVRGWSARRERQRVAPVRSQSASADGAANTLSLRV
jgi:hypothetical protein